MIDFNLNQFINKYVIKRNESFFNSDIKKYHDQLHYKINGKSVLVIGGAGTIGSSFIKSILKFHPQKLTVVDYSENGLTELTRDLRSDYNELIPEEYVTYPFDFGGEIFAKMFRSNKFDIVACFAAHKHVRSEKDHLAIEAMIKNNVYNTKALLELALENKPEHFFSVSTDKAANPVNVMGASKKLMEHVLMSYSNDFKISTARFANVAFSNGSLPFGFIQRIMKRQALSAPNDVRRYFVSPEESGDLCLLASILGETGEVFFPKLAESQMLTFSQIAEDFLYTLGYDCDYCNSEEEVRKKAMLWTPKNKKYPVYFFSTDTSGEKQFEEFYDINDHVNLDQFKAIGVIKKHKITSKIDTKLILNELTTMFLEDNLNKSDVVNMLSKHLSDFKHIETGKNLDQRM